jgi:hypothetical protein
VDLSVLAQNLPKLGAIAGAFGGTHASSAGALAGIGDWQHDQNQRAYEGVKSAADQLEKIDPENWGEAAHEEAMRQRMNLLNPKTIAKIYSNPNAADKILQTAWQSVHAASGRPVDSASQQVDKNAAAGSIPAFQQQQQQAPSMSALGSSMGSAGMPGGAGGGLAMLGNAVGAASGQIGAAGQQAAQSTLAQPPQAMKYGMLSPGERAMRSLAQFRAFQQMQQGSAAESGDGSGSGSGAAPGGTAPGGMGTGGGMTMMPKFGGKAGMTVGMHVDRTTPQLVDIGDGHGPQPGFFDRNAYYLASNPTVPVFPKAVYPISAPAAVTTAGGPTGEQTQFVPRTPGATPLAKPVKQIDETVTRNGVVTKQFVNPITGAVSAPHATGTTPNRDLAAAGYGLRVAANIRAEDAQAIRQANFDYTMSGTTVDVDGSITGVKGARFTPAGTPIDEKGNPVSKAGFSQTKAPAAVLTRARVAGDSRDLADRILQHVSDPALQDKFGPIEGNTLEWAVRHGLIGDADIKGLQMELASLESMNPAVHNMRNFAVAKDIADKLGDMGQPFGNFKSGVKTLRDFYAAVAASATKPVVRAAPAPPKVRAPTAPGAPPAANPPASSNMQTLQQIQQLLGGGGKP